MIPDAKKFLSDKYWLREKLRSGMGVQAIAGTLGCEEQEVRRALILHSETIPLHPWSDIEQQVVLDLYEKYGKLIADGMYRNNNYVWRVAKGLGMDPSYWDKSRGFGKDARRESFWQEWQLYILNRLQDWIESGHWDDVRLFVFHPGLEPEEFDIPQYMIDRLGLEGKCSKCKYAELCHTNLIPLCTPVTLKYLRDIGEIDELLDNITEDAEGISWE